MIRGGRWAVSGWRRTGQHPHRPRFSRFCPIAASPSSRLPEVRPACSTTSRRTALSVVPPRRCPGLVAIPVGDGQTPILVRKALAGYIDQSQFSPDGRWIAYNGDESGRHEVYVTAFPSTGERWQVRTMAACSRSGGRMAANCPTSSLDGVLKAFAIQATGSPQFSVPNRLFDTGLATPSPWIEQYAVSADGRRFLILKPREDKVRNSVGVILNWPALLQAHRSR